MDPIEYGPQVVLFTLFIPDVSWKLSHTCDSNGITI